MPPGPTGVGSVQDEDIWRDLNADELGASQGAAQHSGADAASQGGSAISSIPAYLVKPVRTRPPRKQPTEVADLLARLCSGDKLVHKVAFEEACMGIYKRDRRSKKKLEQEAPGSEAEEGHDRIFFWKAFYNHQPLKTVPRIATLTSKVTRRVEKHAAAWTKPSRPSNGSNLVVIPRTYTGGRSPRSWVQLH